MRHVLLVFGILGLVAMPASGLEVSTDTAKDVTPYGDWIFRAITRMEVCEPFRVMVVYAVGTDMLFVDELVPNDGKSSLVVRRGFSIEQFNHHHASGDIANLACELPAPGLLRITGTYSSGHGDGQYDFRIDMDTSSGKYQYSDTQR